MYNNVHLVRLVNGKLLADLTTNPDPGRCIDMYNLYKCDDSFRYYNNIRHQIAILRTWPKVFSRSTKACCKLLFLTKYFSYSFSSMIIVSNVWAPDMNRHCISSMKIIVLVSFSTALWVKFKTRSVSLNSLWQIKTPCLVMIFCLRNTRCSFTSKLLNRS